MEPLTKGQRVFILMPTSTTTGTVLQDWGEGERLVLVEADDIMQEVYCGREKIQTTKEREDSKH